MDWIRFQYPAFIAAAPALFNRPVATNPSAALPEAARTRGICRYISEGDTNLSFDLKPSKVNFNWVGFWELFVSWIYEYCLDL
jgi:hypothetical protein